METLIQLYQNHQDIAWFLLFLIGTFVLAHVVTFLFRHILSKLTKRTTTQIDDRLLVIFRPIVYWGLVLGGLYFALSSLEILMPYLAVIKSATQVGFVFLMVMISIKLTNLIFSLMGERGLKKREEGFLLTMHKIVNAVLYFLGVIFVLQAVGISIGPLIASLGIGGLTVGLALQPTLSNYFSGLYVAADGFIRPDDFVELDNGLRGYVVEVGWRNTIIRMWDNNLVMIPNAKIADAAITNYDEPINKSSFIVYCGVSYDSDLEHVERIILNTAQKTQENPDYGVEDFKPLVRFYEFGDSNINFKVILQAKKYISHYLMRHEFIMALKKAFDENSIVIAFPTRTVEMAKKDL